MRLAEQRESAVTLRDSTGLGIMSYATQSSASSRPVLTTPPAALPTPSSSSTKTGPANTAVTNGARPVSRNDTTPLPGAPAKKAHARSKRQTVLLHALHLCSNSCSCSHCSHLVSWPLCAKLVHIILHRCQRQDCCYCAAQDASVAREQKTPGFISQLGLLTPTPVPSLTPIHCAHRALAYAISSLDPVHACTYPVRILGDVRSRRGGAKPPSPHRPTIICYRAVHRWHRLRPCTWSLECTTPSTSRNIPLAPKHPHKHAPNTRPDHACTTGIRITHASRHPRRAGDDGCVPNTPRRNAYRSYSPSSTMRCSYSIDHSHAFRLMFRRVYWRTWVQRVSMGGCSQSSFDVSWCNCAVDRPAESAADQVCSATATVEHCPDAPTLHTGF